MLNIPGGDLISLSIESLRENYFDEVGGGFFDFAKGTEIFEVNKTLKKLNYNCVCAIGLSHVRETGLLEKTVKFLSELKDRYLDLVPTWEINNRFTEKAQPENKCTLGEQGLLLWALSKAYSLLKLETLKVQSKNTLNVIYKYADGGLVYHFPHSKFYVPMTMAFILDGLLEYYLITEDKKCGEKIKEIATVLLKNSTPPIFYILRDGKKSEHIYFNNLAYPIHALSRYALIFKDVGIIKKITEIVDRLLLLQGDLGQWWWIYSPRGRVVEKWPVYSVHQHGMAIMALKMAKKLVDESLGLRIDKAIEKSYLWVLGNNEIEASLIDNNRKLIWRSLENKRLGYLGKSISKCLKQKNKLFQVKKDCRSYEYGWFLYASFL